MINITTSITTKPVFCPPIISHQIITCLHQIDPFPAGSNPHNARLCGDKPEFCHQHDKMQLGIRHQTNPFIVGTPPDEMTSSPLQSGKPVTVRNYLVFIRATRTDGFAIDPQTVTSRLGA